MAQLVVTVAVNTALSYGLGLLYQAIVGTPTVKQEGTRLSEVQVTSSTEGSPMKRLWGTSRLGGQIIWQTRFKETKKVKKKRQGGKGGGGQTIKTKTWTYSCSFAIAFCESNGEVAFGRVWADGKLLDLSKHTIRFYTGAPDQLPDPLIEEKEGDGRVPAFRGVAYAVFDNMELEKFGNRIPQITAEIIRSSSGSDFEAWTLIPSAGEFVYGTREYIIEKKGENEVLNVHNNANEPDIIHALDQLQTLAPSTGSILLVVSWFGDDLRIGEIELKPKREVSTSKDIFPVNWRVGPVTQSTAEIVSTVDGNPAYGGTPADIVVREAVAHIKSRGWRCVFYPFILMDIPEGNSLPDIGGGTGQPPYPWRGRITLGDPDDDQEAAAATQVAAFLGDAAPGDFGSWDGSSLSYSGPSEWSYRRMILHYAALLSDILEDGDGFIIGSEMVGATTIRSSSSNYPFVNGLIDLAADVSSILDGGVLISYAADWTEYHSHRPSDGTNDVRFNMDPLWASDDIDFIGIDAYFPISDWRNGTTHADYDAANGVTNIYVKDYLSSNIEGGELYDWYYASDADRTNQVRTPIVDTAEGKHWVFRQKDMRSWWNNLHYNRPGGSESGSPTAWDPTSKPIWFTEFGCPAVDKGSNQPNVFVDPKSSESFVPYFSNGKRDDAIQRVHNQVVVEYWRENGSSGTMIEPANMHVWTWDARPYPWFPYLTDVWSDGGNWELGHWMTGRLGAINLSTLIRDICSLVGIPSEDLNVSNIEASDIQVRGFVVEDLRSPRDMLSDLSSAYSFDGWESGGKLVFGFRATAPVITWNLDDLVTTTDDPGGYSITRAQETELPASLKLQFIDEGNEFNAGGADARTRITDSENVQTISFPLVLDQDYVRAMGDVIIQEARVKRESFEMKLPPSSIRIDPGDVIRMVIKGRSFDFRVSEVDIGDARTAIGVAHDATIYNLPAYNPRTSVPPSVVSSGRATVVFMDIPIATADEPSHHAPRLAAYMNPWPGAVNVFEDDDVGGFELNVQIEEQSEIGEVEFDFFPGPLYRWDNSNDLYIRFGDETVALFNATELSVLNGANAVAVQADNGQWEIVQFVNAELMSPGLYRVSKLLRGQLGTENFMGASAGNRVVVLDPETLNVLDIATGDIGLPRVYRWGAADLPVGNSRYRQATITATAVGLRPYAPADLKARRTAGSDNIRLSWKRRTRYGGDNWAAREIPLNEEIEEYEVDIYDGATVVRTITTSSSLVTYTGAQQIADFGVAQDQIKFKVYQISATFGRGSEAEYDDDAIYE